MPIVSAGTSRPCSPPSGIPLWVSLVLPVGVHDITAACEHVLAILRPFRLLPRRRSGVTNALHPYRADVLAVLDRVLPERAHLGEAKLAVQRDRRVVRQGYPSQGNMNRRLNSQAVKKRVIQRGAHALAPAADVKRDADLNSLPESLEIPVALGAGVAQDLTPPPGHQKPVRSGRTELAEPVASLGHADRLCLEARDGAGRRVVEDADDRRKVFLGRFSDLHLGRSALPAAGSLLHGLTLAASSHRYKITKGSRLGLVGGAGGSG